MVTQQYTATQKQPHQHLSKINLQKQINFKQYTWRVI
jgi:hypothetical protein